VRGEGAWTIPLESNEDAPSPLRVSDCGNPRQARLLRSFESGHTNVSQVDRFAQELEVEVEPIRMDSQAKYSILAAGQAEVYVRLLSPQQPDYKERIWDQAAGSLLVEEAGGRVTDLDGQPLDFTAGRLLRNNRGILATNGHLHSSALRALRAIGA
jgi:3'(2'), 5'-bisphosphate nucleotidase